MTKAEKRKWISFLNRFCGCCGHELEPSDLDGGRCQECSSMLEAIVTEEAVQSGAVQGLEANVDDLIKEAQKHGFSLVKNGRKMEIVNLDADF